MSLPTEKGIDPPQSLGVESWEPYWILWLKRFQDAFPKVGTYSASLTPLLVAANTTAEQTFTVNGLVTSDIVTVNKPTHQAGLGIAGARVSAKDTIAITYINPTAGAIIPTSETYTIVSVRL